MPGLQNSRARENQYSWPTRGALSRLTRRSMALMGMAVAFAAFDAAAAEDSLAPLGTAVGSAEQSDAAAQQSAPWRVMIVTGTDRYRMPDRAHGAWQSLYPGILIGPGAQVKTGDDGQVELFNGRDRIVIGSSSNIGLPGAALDPKIVTILQNGGSVHYEVQSRRNPAPQPRGLMSRIRGALFGREGPKERFEVRTPFLVAIVKGTAFHVSVEQQRAEVSVTEGVVSVTDHSGRGGADVAAGETASAEASSAGVGSASTSAASSTGGKGHGKGHGKGGKGGGKSGEKDSKGGKGGKGGGKGGGNAGGNGGGKGGGKGGK